MEFFLNIPIHWDTIRVKYMLLQKRGECVDTNRTCLKTERLMTINVYD